MRLRTFVWVSGVCAIWAGCGGGDDSEPSSGGGSFTAIADSIAKPSGQLAASNATDVADEFAKISMTGAAGGRRTTQQAGGQTQEIACTAGGKQTITASGSQSGGHAVIKYDNCCYQASCCFNGGGDWYYAAQAGASYSFCGSYNMTLSCGTEGSASVKYEGCVGMDGKWVYVVRVDGKTFAVTGNYSNGNGTLEITGANGSFSCTYSNHTGSCTGSSGNFSF
jgi:hypothetical protein